MNKSFEELLERLSKDQALLSGVEEATKQGAVLPILYQIGWDCFNLQEVSPEYSIGSGRVDYCLCIGQKKTVFIEVKRPTEELDRHEEQLLRYSFTEGVDIAVLTNGLQWWFYLPLVGGNWQQRKFFAIDIKQQNLQVATKHFKDFIGRDSIADGSAVQLAKSIKDNSEKMKLISHTIPVAWEQLITEPDELLIELFSDKVESICGYEPDPEQLTEYIRKIYLKPQITTSLPKPIDASRQFIKTLDDNNVFQPTRVPRQRGTTITIDNEQITASSVSDLYRQTMKYLFTSNMIAQVKRNIPYATSSVRLLISNDPHHQDGKEFRVPVVYEGLYMEAHKDYKNALAHLEAFLKRCGIVMKYK